MSYDQIGAHIKSRLDQYESELNHNSLWDAIEPELEDRRKRPMAWWIFGGLSILALISYSWANNSNEDSEIEEKNQLIANNATVATTSTKAIGENSPKLASNEILVSEVQSQMRLNAEESIEKEIVILDNLQKQVSKDRALEDQLVEDKSALTSLDNEVTNLEVHKVNEHYKVEHLLPLGIEPLVADPIRDLKFTRVVDLITPLKKNTQFMDLHYGIAFPISENKNGADNIRNNAGDFLLTQNVALGWGRKFYKGFYGRVGARYSRAYNILDSMIERDSMVPSPHGVQVIEQNILADGQVEVKTGIPLVNAKYSRRLSRINHFDYLSLSLGLGYQLDISNMKLLLEMRYLMDFSIRQSGYYTKSNNDRFYKLSGNSKVSGNYKNRIGASMGLAYPFRNDLSMIANLQLETSQVNTNLTQEQNRYLLGVGISLRYSY